MNELVYKTLSAVCIILMLPLIVTAFVLVLILTAVKMIFEKKCQDDPDFWQG